MSKKNIKSQPKSFRPKKSYPGYVEIHLGYYKQGDDLQYCLDKYKDHEKALKLHADKMRSVAKHLDKLAAMISGEKIEIQADTHYISITCDKVLADKIVKAGLGEYPPKELWEDEE